MEDVFDSLALNDVVDRTVVHGLLEKLPPALFLL